MLVQPYLENAIWHGLMHKDGFKSLQLTIKKQEDELVVSIRDNGIGRKAAQAYRSSYSDKKESFGMTITKDRISMANKLYGSKIELDIVDHIEDGSPVGTEVILTIPIPLKLQSTVH